MGIWSRITGQDSKSEPLVQSVAVPKKKQKGITGSFLDFGTLGGRGLSSETNISDKLIKAYSEWVFINVSVLAEEVSKLELELYKTVLKGGKLEMEIVETHPILDLLDQWNDKTTASDGFYMTEAHLDLAGDSFWYLEGGDNGKQPTAIYILPPERVELDLKESPEEGGTIINGYEYKPQTDKGDGPAIKYSPDEVLHIKVPDPGKMYRGKSTVEAIAQTIDTEVMSAETSRKFYEQGMLSQFVLTTEQRLNQDQIKRLQAELRAAYTGAKNAWKVPIFGGGIKVEQISLTPKESLSVETNKWLRDKIMTAFKNTPMSLGIVEDVNRAQGESSIISWKRSVIKPKIQRIVDAINEFIVPRYGDNLILGFKDPVPEDISEKVVMAAELYAKPLSQVLTQDEARELFGLPPLEEAETIPKSVRNVNYKAVLRKNKTYAEIEKRKLLKESIKPQIRKMLKEKKITPRKMRLFQRRIEGILDKFESVFRSRAEGFITQIVNESISKLDDEEARQTGILIDEKAKVQQAQAVFGPVLDEALITAGNEANKLLGINKPYVPKAMKQFDVRSQVDKQVSQFAMGMIQTDRDLMVDILAGGLQKGESIPQIRKQIEDKFSQYTRTQAERITRTEVATAANAGIRDAYQQSGVVIEKQWLTAGDPCEFCAPMNGAVVSVEGSYFEQGSTWLGDKGGTLSLDYRNVDEPPLHPNCRCTVIAVIKDVGPLIPPSDFSPKRVETVTYYRGSNQESTGPDDYPYSLGYGMYASTTREHAAAYGDVSDIQIPAKSKIMKIKNQKEYEELFAKANADYPYFGGNFAVPRYVLSLGFQGAQYGDIIALYDYNIIPKGLSDVTNIRIAELEAQKAELESKIDKRTKKYRKLKEAKLEDEDYIKSLEKLINE